MNTQALLVLHQGGVCDHTGSADAPAPLGGLLRVRGRVQHSLVAHLDSCLCSVSVSPSW